MDEFRLLSLLSAEQPRRQRVIENVLKGRRTVSTLFWGMRYGILDWLGYEKRLSRQYYDGLFHQLLAEEKLASANQQFVLTAVGQSRLTELAPMHYQPRFLGVGRQFDGHRFKERLLLMIQVVSEFSYGNRRYYPLQVSQDNLQFVRSWFRWFKQNNYTVEAFQSELETYLSHLGDDQLALMLAQRFVGHDTVGETTEQLALQLERPASQIAEIQDDLMLGMIPVIQANEASVLYPILSGLVINPLSESAYQTLTEIKRGLTFDQIIRARRLKESTVREHMLEAAILLPIEDVPYDRLLNEETQASLNKIFESQALDDWDFERAHSKMPALSFFEFRLYQILRSKTN